jgi:predicted metal-dependent hydrolase
MPTFTAVGRCGTLFPMNGLMTVCVDGGDIVVERKVNPRGRRAWLAVHPDGRATLSVPAGMREAEVERFVREQADWMRRQLARVSRYKNDIFLPRDRRSYLARKEDARKLVAACIARLNGAYGFRYGRVSIKDLRRNWGSCSAKGNLNFNYKLAFLPLRLAEYVVAHELCHLKELNHSPRFWALVAKTFPDHRALRRELRTYHS